MREETFGPVRLLLGDARDLVPELGPVEAIITDPIWPKHGNMFGEIDATELLRTVLAAAAARRVVVQMRNDQDPRFLAAVPERWPFLQAMWLRYASVGYNGRHLTGNEIAYGFGDWPPPRNRKTSVPAIGPVALSRGRIGWHPAPRSIAHLRWLVEWWGATGPVLDPFAGSGTTLVACAEARIPAIGIEINSGFFDGACRRIEAAMDQGVLELGRGMV